MRTSSFLVAVLVFTAVGVDCSRAQVTEVSLSGVSYHFDRSREWNEMNPGLHLQWAHRWWMGMYENSSSHALYRRSGEKAQETGETGEWGRSNRRFTAYVGWGRDWQLISWVRLRALAGISVGYGDFFHRFGAETPLITPLPYVFPTVEVGPSRGGLEAFLWPVGGGTVGVKANIRLRSRGAQR